MKINWKKYLCMLVMVCVLLSGKVFPAFAEESGDFSPVGFVLEDKLYSFLEADGEEEVKLSLNERIVDKKELLKPLKDSGQYVHYFLLLDRSTSMEKYMPRQGNMGQIGEFAERLLENIQVRTRVSLLSLGDAFEVEMENAEDKDAILKKLAEIPCDEKKSNLYKGIDSALDYVEGQERRGGDLYHVILITDGKLYKESEEPTFEQIKERIGNVRDIIFTTVGLGEGTDSESLSLGRNMTGQDVSSAALEIAQTVNEMYTVCFELDSKPVDSNLNVKLISMGGKVWEIIGVPVVRGRISEATETEEPEKQQLEAGEESGEQLSKDMEEFQEQSSEDSGQKQQGQFGQLFWYVLFLLGGIVFGCGLALLWKKKQSDLQPSERRSRAEEKKDILLCVEVISGHCLTKKRNFSLHQDILIGCGRKCDIVWENSDVSEQNSRIFVRDGVVYIEDLDSRYGTVVNGMRIYTQNRLRDGDIISIGRIQFRILL